MLFGKQLPIAEPMIKKMTAEAAIQK